MVRAIDYLCGDFAPESVQKNYLHSEEAVVMERIGRTGMLADHSDEKFMQHLTEVGVEKVIVVGLLTWNYWKQEPIEETTVPEVVRLMEAFPGRVHGIYGVNVRKRLAGVAELEDAVRNHGFVGMHIHPHGFGFPPNHAYYFPYYAKCQELGIPAVVTMGHTMDFMPIEYGRPLYLDDVALYFPDLTIVLGHTGWPWVDEALALVQKHPNVFMGTSAYSPKYWKPELVQFINSSRGRGKVMWGTDWPVVQHAEALQQIQALELREESEEALLYGVADRVFKLS
jgi:predicted TIM-barrel fold metal-dependent hydrolase